jgi:hypothetical protein
MESSCTDFMGSRSEAQRWLVGRVITLWEHDAELGKLALLCVDFVAFEAGSAIRVKFLG